MESNCSPTTPFQKCVILSSILRIVLHLRNIKYCNCLHVITPPMTGQSLAANTFTGGELDKVTGLIPNRTQRCWWCEATVLWEAHQLLPWQSETSGGRASSVPRILPPLNIYQGFWCSSSCEWEEIKVLSSKPGLEIPFVRDLKMIG